MSEGVDHVFRCNLQLNSIQPRLYPTNISLWRFPLCNPLKLYLLICISITESPSVLFTPTLGCLWNERRVCIRRAHTYIRTSTSSFIVLTLRKPGLLCQRSLGQSCYADVLWSMVVKYTKLLWSKHLLCDFIGAAAVAARAHMVPLPAVNHLTDTDEYIFHIRLADSISRMCPSNN